MCGWGDGWQKDAYFIHITCIQSSSGSHGVKCRQSSPSMTSQMPLSAPFYPPLYLTSHTPLSTLFRTPPPIDVVCGKKWPKHFKEIRIATLKPRLSQPLMNDVAPTLIPTSSFSLPTIFFSSFILYKIIRFISFCYTFHFQ